MSRLLAAFFSVLLTLMLLGAGLAGLLLLTTEGARWLADWAMELEPRLTLTVEGGALGNELIVSDLGWQDEGVEVSVEGAELAWSPGCLLTTRLCLDRIALTGVRVALEPGGAETESGSDSELARIELPLPVQLRLLQLNDVQVALPDMQLSLRQLQASAGFRGSTFTLNWLRANALDIAMSTPVQSEPVESEQTPLTEFSLDLPEIELPLDLVLRNLVLSDSSLEVDDTRFAVRELMLSASLRGSQLEVERIELDTEQLVADLIGSVTLAGNYPLSAKLNTRLNLPDLPMPLTIAVDADGSLQQLALGVDLHDPQQLHVDAELQLLTAGLPFDLAADWQQLVYPSVDAPLLALQEGALKIQGDLASYAGELKTSVAGEQIPEGDWYLHFVGDAEHLEIQELTAGLLAGELEASGLLQWREGVEWQASLKAHELNPGEQWPDYPGRIGGRVDARGQLDDAGLAFSVNVPGLDGRVLDYPFSLSGQVDKSADDHWLIDQLRLVSGSNHLGVDGRLAERWDLRGTFELGDAAELLPELSGHGAGRFAVQGEMTEPDVVLELQAGSLQYEDYGLAAVELQLDMRRLGLEQSRLHWSMEGVQLDEQHLSEIRVELQGSRAQHELSISADGGDLGGQIGLQGELDEQFNWNGLLESARLALPPEQQWTLAEAVELHWQHAQRQLFLTAHCWRQQDASLCLTEDTSLGEQGDVKLALASFHLDWLSPWMPDGLAWRAPLSADLQAQWQSGEPPTVRAEVHSRSGLIALEQEEGTPLELPYEHIALTAALEQNTLQARLELASEQLGSGHLEAQTRLGEELMPLRGEVGLDGLQLSPLGAFLPNMQRLEGVVSAHGRLGGDLQDPEFHGKVQLADGEVVSPQLPVSLTDIQLVTDISGQDAQLQGSFQSGDGRAQLDGSASWGGDAWQLVLGLKGDRLRVMYEQIADLDVSPDLSIHVQPEQVMVEGRVLVPKGKITLKELPEGAIGVSDDVVVIRRKEPLVEDETPAANWQVMLDIELALGDSVQVEGFGLTGRLAGELRMRQRPDAVPEAAGDLHIVDGRYKAYGQNLEIRQGQLLFSGPLTQPDLNVEAVRRVDHVVAGLRVEGEPEAPQVSLFSEPGLPQEEILSYLIRGRPLDSEGAGSDQLLAQAALSLGIFGGQGFASSLASGLGVEDFEVGTAGEGDDTQVELSGYLTPDLLVRYGIGVFEPVNTLTLRYRISKSFFVEAVSGLESALDFFYQFEF